MRRLFLLLLFVACGAAAQEDDRASYAAWQWTHDVREFERYLATTGRHGVLPTRELLRTASDWERCGGPRYEVPPRERWPQVLHVLDLVTELKKQRILQSVEAVSAYRNPGLNACAQGAPGSAHTRGFALDLAAGVGRIDLEALCRFWRREGES